MRKLCLLLACAACCGALPLAQWSVVDNGEVISIDMPFSVYRTNNEKYALAFQTAVEEALSANVVVRVVNFAPSSVGTVNVYFDVLLPATTDYAAVANFFSVQSLFCPPPNGSVQAGTPACPVLLNALTKNMAVALGGASYNDQLTQIMWQGPAPGESPSTREVVALDIQFDFYAIHEEFYSAAFAGALGNVTQGRVYVTDFQRSSADTVRVFCDVYDQELNVATLFDACGTQDRLGCPAPLDGVLIEALTSQGLPVAAYYYDQHTFIYK